METDLNKMAAEMIAAERQRQRMGEGWSDEHDRRHRDRELSLAGMVYLHWDTKYRAPLRPDGAPLSWPWEAQWFKPKDEVRNLVRAGALFVAENDRLLAAGAGHFGPDNWKPHLYHKYSIARDRLAALLRDSDGSGEAGETATKIGGSTEGDSAGPEGIAQGKPS